MTIPANTALQAYRQAVSKINTPGMEPRDSSGTGDFGALVKQLTESSMGAAKASETLSAQAASGSANMGDVVTAVANAEVALQTVVAVRDRVISAYQDIIRMPI